MSMMMMNVTGQVGESRGNVSELLWSRPRICTPQNKWRETNTGKPASQSSLRKSPLKNVAVIVGG